jgi:hypothetical protein
MVRDLHHEKAEEREVRAMGSRYSQVDSIIPRPPLFDELQPLLYGYDISCFLLSVTVGWP